MNLTSKLLISLKKRTGNVVLRHELLGLGSPSHLSDALRQLIDEGKLVRLGAGVYAKAKPGVEGNARFAVNADVLLREVLDKLGVPVLSVSTQQEQNADVCVVDTGTKRVSRKLGWDNTQVRFIGQDNALNPGQPSRLATDVEKLPTKNVGEFVEQLAKSYGVQFRRSGLDEFAEAVTRAAGDDVTLDHIGKLLVALKKQDRIDGKQLVRLMANHMRELKRVRPIRRLRDQRLSP